MSKAKSAGAFVMLPRALIQSEAWRSLGINARRLIDFLMIEHMRHWGKKNGLLLAPRQQLEQFGIGTRYISGAIEQAERLGLVDCRRGVGRSPSVYGLTWLPMSDGNQPSNRWRSITTPEPRSLQMTSEGKHLRYPKGSHKGDSDFQREVTKPPKHGYPKGSTYIENSYHRVDDS